VTAFFVLYLRWVYHKTGFRADPASSAIFEHHEFVPNGVLRFMYILGQRFVYALTPASVPFEPMTIGGMRFVSIRARLVFFDNVMKSCAPDQLVVMGAGFDTRALSNNCGGARRVFEVDRPETQAAKRALLSKAGLSSPILSFVECNFNSESPWDKLRMAGFDASKPFVVLWEGVTMYLEPDAVKAFFKSAASVMEGNPRAFLTFDFLYLENMESVKRASAKTVSRLGEPWICGLPKDLNGYLRDQVGSKLYVVDQVPTKRGAIALVASA